MSKPTVRLQDTTPVPAGSTALLDPPGLEKSVIDKSVIDKSALEKSELVRNEQHQHVDASLQAPSVRSASPLRKRRPLANPGLVNRHYIAEHDEQSANRQAELFYLQKQIQQQTPMVFVLEDGNRIQGVIEWYDRQCIKVRGKSKVLLYKSAIKYMHKVGEVGSASNKIS